MNKNRYRIIFNQARGMLMAVAETTTSQGKSASGESRAQNDAQAVSADATAANRVHYKALNPLVYALMLSFGATSVSVSMDALATGTMITADHNAPGNQQATVLPTASGIQQVNIQTPSAAGVSRNTYSQFDVGNEGVVLNNSRSNTQTQLAGWIQGNPWLAKGQANVILNEVNSSNPSYLRGYLEVAGGKAQVVVANPSGLVCDGCGVINASRFTLTTGQAVMNNGSLDAFVVRQGNVAFEGKGMDATGTPFTDIISRAMTVNAGVYANQLNVALGQNTVKNALDGAQLNTTITPDTSATAAPSFALDAGQLGGMYAGKIFLLGTENGVGVRNAGTINATQGQLQLDVNGNLTNSGNLIANNDVVNVNSQALTNSGNISSGQAAVHLNQNQLSNSGLISSADELVIHNNTNTGQGALNNNGGTLNAARIDISAESLSNQGGHIQQTASEGLNLQAGSLSNKQGQLGNIPAPSSTTGGSTTPPTTGGSTGAGSTTAPNTGSSTPPTAQGGQVTSSTPTTVKTYSDGVINTTNQLNNDSGVIAANGGINLALNNSSALGLNNAGGQMALGTLSVSGDQLNNQSGQLFIQSANINTSSLNNQSGYLSVDQLFNIHSQQVNNQLGTIIGNQQLNLIADQAIDNTQGKIVATNALQLQTPSLINSQGVVISQQNALSLAVSNAINNASGTLQAATTLVSHSTTLNNQLGQILAQDIAITASQSLNNQQGLIHSGNTLSIASPLIDNGIASTTATAASAAGQITADGNLSLTSTQLNNSGLIYSKQNVSVQSGQITQQGGTLAAAQNTTIVASSINADHQSRLVAGLQVDGTLSGASNLTVQADQVALHGQQLASGDITITGNQAVNLDQSSNQASNITVQSGTNVSHQGASSVATNQLVFTGIPPLTPPSQGGESLTSIDNQSGILSANALSLNANLLNNQSGTILNSGTQDLSLNMQNGINNQAGIIHTNSQNLNLSSVATIDNSQGSIIHAGSGGLNITANQLLGTAGQIDSNGQLTVKTAGQTVLDQGKTTAGQITVTADSLSNQGGQLVQTGTTAPLSLTTSNGLNNSTGVISSQAGVNVSAGSVNNQTGQILSNTGTDLNLTVAGNLDNSQAGQINSGANTLIQAGSINNTTGSINAQGAATLKATSAINNTAGHIAANNDVSLSLAPQSGSGLNNNQGSIGSVNGAVNIDAGSGILTNQTGQVQAGTDLSVKAGSIDNSVNGQMSAQGIATVHSANALNNQTGQIIANGDVTVTSQGLNNNQGQIASVNGVLNINAGSGVLSNQTGKLQSGGMSSTAAQVLTASSIDNTSGLIDAAGSLALQSGQAVINQNGQIIAGNGPINISASSFNNQGGSLQTNTGFDLNLTIIGLLDNSQYGKLISGANTLIQTGSLNNATGTISAQGTATVKASAGIDNTAGSMVANGDVQVSNQGSNSSSINNNQGSIGSAKGLLNVDAGSGVLTNNAGKLQAASTLNVTANGIDNTSGFINAQGNIQLLSNQYLINQGGQIETTAGTINASAASLNNQGGIIQTNPSYDIVLGISGLLDNSQKGQINSGANVQLTAGQVNNTAGQINAQSAATLKTTQDINNTSGSIVANSDVNITSNGLNNNQGQVSSAKGLLNINAGSGALNNQTGTLQAGTHVTLAAAGIDNSAKGVISAQDAVTLTSTGLINNNTGSIVANNDVNIGSQGAAISNDLGSIGSVNGQVGIDAGGGVLTNKTGLVQAGTNLTVKAGSVDNSTQGKMTAQGTATLNTTSAVNNQSGTIVANDAVNVTAQGVNNNAGQIGSANSLVNINAGNAALTNQSGHIQATTTINLTADSIDSTAGFIDAQGNIQITSAQSLVNQGGQIVSNAGTVNAAAASLNNRGGTIQTNPANDLNLTIIGLLDNTQYQNQQSGKILSGGNTLLQAGQINNTAGQITAQGTATLTTSQDINNTSGSIIANGDVNVTSNGLNNNQGMIGSAKGLLNVNASNAALTNQGGHLQAATTVNLIASSIDSTSGFINAQGNIQIVSNQALVNQGGQIETAAGTINATAASLNNQSGVIQTNPANDIALTVSGLLDNSQSGQINSGHDVLLQAGQLNNTASGRITAQNAANLSTTQGIDNTAGTITANNTVGINSQGLVNNGANGQITAGQSVNVQANQLGNAGLIYAAGVTANTTNDLVNIGTIGAANQITLSGSSINSSGSLLAGLNPDGSFNSTGNLTATAQNGLTATGKNIAGSTLQFTGATVDASGSTAQATTVGLTAQSGNLTLDNAQVSADQLSLQTPATLSTQSATVKTNTLGLTAHDWNNTAGTFTHSSTQNLTVNLAGDLTNTNGLIESNAQQLQLNANNIINQGGNIVSLGQQLGLSSNSLQSTNGKILAAGSINTNIAGQTTLDGGVLQGHGLNLSTANLSNQSGQIIDLAASQSSNINVSQVLNNNAGLIYSQNNLNINAGTLTNQSGQIVSASNPLALAIQGILDNSAGLIKSGNSLNIGSAGLINNGGRISSLQPLVLNITGATQNLSGLINSQSTLQFNGQSIDNTGGEISSAGSLSINSNGQQLTNNSGTIGNASGSLTLATGAISNNAGLIQTAGDLSVNTNHQLLSNTNTNTNGKGIVAQGNATINASSLDNTSGVVQTAGTLTANLDSDLINKSGSISATTANLNATNSIQNQLGLITGDTVNLQTASLINDGDNGLTPQGSVINANNLTINAASISNQNTKLAGTAQGIQANTINIVGNTGLNNTSGSIRSGSTDIQTTGTVNNTNGLISATNSLNIHDDQATRTATITNTGGTIVADNNLNVKVKQLSTDGQLTTNNAGSNMTVDLQSDYTNASATQLNAAGNLNLITTGAITNQSDLVAGEALTVNALSLDNQFGAKLAGGTNTTVQTSGDITNRGLINGGNGGTAYNTTLIANTINNTGTGRIYGDHIAIQANTLNNSPEGSTASVIASRGDMDIGVTTLNNNPFTQTSQEMIYSGGDLRIGLNLDSALHATGTADTVNNLSAQIQSSGNMDINANTVNNLNVLYQVTQNITTTSNRYGQPNALVTLGDPTTGVVSPWYYQSKNQVYFISKGNACISGYTGCFESFWSISLVNQITTTDQLVPGTSTPAQLIAGGNLNFEQATVNNTGGQIIAGGTISGGTVNNKSVQGQEIISISGTAAQHYIHHGGNYHTTQNFTYPNQVTTFDLLSYTYQPSTPSSAITSAEANSNNISTSSTAGLVNASATTQGSTGLSSGTASTTANSNQLGTLGANTNATQTGAATSTQTAAGTIANTVIGTVTGSGTAGQATGITNTTTVGTAGAVGQSTANAGTALSPAGSGAGTQPAINAVVTSTSVNGNGTIQHITASSVNATSAQNSTSGVNDQSGTAAQFETRTLDKPTAVPNNGLFMTNTNSSAGYIVQTDPAYTMYQNWLSSDYMLKALNISSDYMQKRLGDGFYEQRLVQDQIQQLTGRRFLSGFDNDDTQYKALMNNGITYAKQWDLRPGIALTAAQAAQLTSDIVWLVEKTITLPNGSTVKALVPQVYVRAKVGDLMGDGSLISGDQVIFTTKQAINNQGTIAGRQLVSLQAGDITNSGNIKGSTVGLVSDKDIGNTGNIQADDRLILNAGRDLNNQNGSITSGNTAMISTGRDLNNIGGKIGATNAMSVNVGRDLNLTTTTSKNTSSNNNKGYGDISVDRIASLYVGDRMSSTAAQGDPTKVDPNQATLAINVGGNTTLKAAEITNTTGATVLNTKGNIDIGAVQTVQHQYSATSGKHSSSSTSTTTTTDVGSKIDSVGSLVMSGNNITVTGSSLNSQQGTTALTAADKLLIQEGRQVTTTTTTSQQSKKGFLGLSKSSSSSADSSTSDVALASTVEGKNVVLNGNTVKVQGSNVVADNNVSITGTNGVSIVAAENRYSEDHQQQSKKSGLLHFSATGYSIGKQQQEATNGTTTVDYTASNIGALNGNIDINSNGQYLQQGSNLTAKGTDANSGNITVNAGSIKVEDVQDTATQHSEQKQKQTGLTVGISTPVVSTAQDVHKLQQSANNTSSTRMKALAAGTAAMEVGQLANNPKSAGSLSVSAMLGTSKSKSTSDSTTSTSTGSTINGNNVSLNAHGQGVNSDLTIKGSDINATNNAQLHADHDINVLAGENTSSNRSASNNQSAAIGVIASVGQQTTLGITANGSAGRGKSNADTTTYSNSHITAGNQLQISSGNDTTIKGGVLNGKQVQGDIGGQLTVESLQDKSIYVGGNKQIGGSATLGIIGNSSASVNASQSKLNSDYLSVNEQSAIHAGDQGFQLNVGKGTHLKGGTITSTDAAVDNKLNQLNSHDGISTEDLANHADYKAQSTSISAGSSSAKQGNGAPALSGMGVGSDSSNASSITKAGVSGIAGDTTVRTGTDSSGKLQNKFNADKVQKDVEAQASITQQFGQQASKAIGDYAAKKEIEEVKLRVQAEQTSDLDQRKALIAQADQIEADWGKSGTLRIAAHAVVGGLTGGVGGAAGAAAGTVTAPEVAKQLEQAGITGTLANTLTAVASTAVGAAAGGTTGAMGAYNEVNNNYLNHKQINDLSNRLKKECKSGDKACISNVYADAVKESKANNEQVAACAVNSASASCTSALQEMARVQNSGEEASFINLLNSSLEKTNQVPQKVAESLTDTLTVKATLTNNNALTSKVRAIESGQLAGCVTGAIPCMSPTPDKTISQHLVELVNDATIRPVMAALGFTSDLGGQEISPRERQEAILGLVAGGLAKVTTIAGQAAIQLSDSAAQAVIAKYGNDVAKSLNEQLVSDSLQASGAKLGNLKVLAQGNINGRVYVDSNQTARATATADANTPTLISDNIAVKPPQSNGSSYPNANMADAHAEIGVIQQAYDAGQTVGQQMTLTVAGKAVCGYCVNDIALAAQKAGLKSLTVDAVNDKGVPVKYFWQPGMTSIKLVKP